MQTGEAARVEGMDQNQSASAGGRKWRICFFAPGSNIHTKRWVEAMADRGHEVLLVSTDRPREIHARVFYAEPGRASWRFLPKLRGGLVHREMARATAEFRPDFVHMHWLNSSVLAILQSRHWDRLLISAWGSDVLWDASHSEPWMRRKIRGVVARRASMITATSEYLARRTVEIVGLTTRPTVVPFGIDTDLFSPGAPRAKRGEVVIGYLKHYLSRYGAETAVRAMVRVRAACPAARLEMHGTGDRSSIEKLVGELGLRDAVRVCGPLAHGAVPAAMREFDVYCMPSLSESFGVSALEASSCGVPVVASDVGGVPEVVEHGRTGLLVKVGDVDALAEALIQLAWDASLRSRLGAAGRELVVKRYQWADSVSAMERVYERLMSAGGSASGVR